MTIDTPLKKYVVMASNENLHCNGTDPSLF